MLSIADTKEILQLGGTILGTTNKGHPFEYREFDKEGREIILVPLKSLARIDRVRFHLIHN